MNLLSESAKGVYLITVTPFTDDGTLDLVSTGRMIEFCLERGVDGFTVLGVMGEAPKLSAEESRRYVECVMDEVDGRVPVIVGVSSPGFAAMSELAKQSMDLGAAGVMIAPAATVKIDEQAYQYFEMAAETVGVETPFCVQDHPLATGVQLPASVILRIVKSIPNCVMLKHEDWPGPGLAKVAGIRKASEEQGLRRISILAGNGGGLFLPEELARGVDGAMTGFAYPEMMVEVCRAHFAGDVGRAADVFDAYLPLARYEQQAALGLAVRKYLLQKRGAIASASLRKPGAKLSAADVADVERLVARQESRLVQLR
ncbi:MAG: dihydrodipicolinate synthase family protein [Betaproteobacteria bacterium]|nr:dihydrodipicolinate synthase family protein [Betaproteobacteria bacterium]